jgi:GTPase
MFVDEADVRVVSGHGGRGAVSFRREKFVPRGGPDGGDGGKGGSVYLVADAHRNTLLHFRYNPEHKAANGRPGEGSRRTGQSGGDLRVPVPVGTLVFERSPEQPDVLVPIADLAAPGQKVLVAKGGRGGLGNAYFATSTNRSPRKAQPGEPGEDRQLCLQLKLLADVGLIGFPNAGKSTLIARISAARPKIADYPFTTLTPNLGVVGLSDDRSFVVADVPGLIEGAHAGHGLGHQFLRHVERTKVLLHLVDVSSLSGRDPVEDFDVLCRELELYNSAMLAKPQIVVATKIDALDDPDRLARLEAHVAARGLPFARISAVTGAGVAELLEAAWPPIAEGRAAEVAALGTDDLVEEAEPAEASPPAADYNPALVPPLKGRTR